MKGDRVGVGENGFRRDSLTQRQGTRIEFFHSWRRCRVIKPISGGPKKLGRSAARRTVQRYRKKSFTFTRASPKSKKWMDGKSIRCVG